MKNTLYIVIPCYNEEEVIKETIKVLKKKIESLIKNNKINKNSKVLFVNDGSCDNTWKIIKDISSRDKLFTGISLSKNRGHQNALVAGLLVAKDYANAVISMDADLQDDVNAIDGMVEEYLNGSEIVYGVRKKREKDSFFKRFTAELFYKIMLKMGVDIVYNHADYRLTSKRVLEEFSNYKEVNLFLRGIFPLIGFKSSIVYYDRDKRFAGESKYPLKKMLNFAWDGVTSFSIKPIRLIVFWGLFQTVISFICFVVFLVINLTQIKTIGMGSIISLMFFLSGTILLAIGIVGEYVGKTYFESKQRPRYIIEENLMDKKE